MLQDAKWLMAFMTAVGNMNPDDSYMAMVDYDCESFMAHCEDCCYYRQNGCCDLDNKPTHYYKLACERYEPKERNNDKT